MIRTSTAVWRGDGLHGKGGLSTQSGVFKEQPYSFQTRFQSEDGKAGTNPEELLAAAHAGCFTMALSLMLGEAKLVATQLDTSARVTLEKVGDGFTITAVHLTLKAKIPNADDVAFQAA